jgi:hypothetical protein
MGFVLHHATRWMSHSEHLSLATNDYPGVLAILLAPLKLRVLGKSHPADSILEQSGELKQCFGQR